MAQVPSGTSFAIASAYSTAIAVTSITNASQGVVTTGVAHTYANGDFVEITNTWFTSRMFRISAASGSTFTLEGFDTSSTALYPAGGAGTVRRVSTWTPLAQVMNVSPSGGDAVQVQYRYIDQLQRFQIQDGFNPVSYDLDLDADSNATAGYLALRSLTAAGSVAALRITLKSGGIVVQPCTVALNETIVMQDGQVNYCRANLAGVAQPNRY